MGERKEAVLTNAEFAQRCAYIAVRAAKWSGDLLTLPETHEEAAPPVAVARFIRDIQGFLDHLEPYTGRKSPPSRPLSSMGDGE